jgi:multidrug efflux pump
VLCSVFVPTTFLTGITGQFYRQFALTIAASTAISAVNAMTMTPSRCVQIFGGTHGHGHKKEALPWWGIAALLGLLCVWLLQDYLAPLLGIHLAAGHEAADEFDPWPARALQAGLFVAGAAAGLLAARPIGYALNVFLAGFNRVFDAVSSAYGKAVGGVVRLSVIMLLLYGGLMGITGLGFRAVPGGFIPEQDKGYLVVSAQLPDGASLERTEIVARKIDQICKETPGVAHRLSVPGYSLLTSVNLSNAASMFVILDEFETRRGRPELSANAVMAKLRTRFATEIREAVVVAFGAPPVEGVGSTGGFKLQVQDRGSAGFEQLQGAVRNLSEKANQQPGLIGVFSTFTANQPQLFVDVDRTKAKAQKVALDDVFSTLQANLGSAYVNDFTRFGRNWQVTVQADATYRLRVEDVGRLKVRNADGHMVPLATLLTVKEVSGPAIVNHYNLFPSAEVMGNMAPGTSSGQAIALMDELARQELPPSMGSEWTELTLLQILASEDVVANLIFPLGVVFVFMVLAAKYESWILPMAIILIVPMCLFAAIGTVWALGMDNNIFTQIGMMVLVGLAAKNAILIVEFAKQREDAGEPRIQAIQEACRLRLRPILMTSFAFILGVLPLVRAQGAGAEMRIALGVAVFSGMIGVTLFGLVFTPVFYYSLMWVNDRLGWDKKPGVALPPIPTGLAPALPAEGPRQPPEEGIQARPQ